MLRDVEISPTAPAALVDLESVKDYLGIADMTRDAVLGCLIDAASATIEAYCGTVVAQRTVTERLTLEDSMRSLVLRYAPAIALTSLSFDGAAETLADYRLAKATGMVRHVEGSSFSPAADWVAVYTAGFAEIPQPIQQAARDIVKYLHAQSQRDETVQRESVPDVGDVAYVAPAAILVAGQNGAMVPSSAATLLAPYVQRYTP